MKALLIICVLVVATTARAETVVVAGVELRLPEGWDSKTRGNATILTPTKYKGRAIDVFALPKMPAATAEAFKTLLGGDKLELTVVGEAMREGAKVIGAHGKMVAKGGAGVEVDILVVPVGAKAAMLVSFVGADQDPLVKQANIDILKSARVPGPRISVDVVPPKSAKMVAMPKYLVEGITKIASAFDTSLRLPRPLKISMVECGLINAHYIKDKHAIELCHDLYDDFLGLFAADGMDKGKIEETAAFAMMFVFMHEFGHALVGEFDLQITGSGEDAADEIATLILGGNPKSAKIALAGATWFEVKAKKPGHKDNYWSTHSFDQVRFASILCLLYGVDKPGMTPLTTKYKVPAQKLSKCARDTPVRMTTWKKMLAPFAVKKKKS